MRGAESSKWFIYIYMKFTLNWNITTYEATAMGGREAPTILTSSSWNLGGIVTMVDEIACQWQKRIWWLRTNFPTMAALAPPLNTAGVPLPPVPANPASLVDITNAKEYIDQLSSNKCETNDFLGTCWLINQLQSITTVSAIANAATTNDIGQADTYRTAVIFSHSPGGNAAPPWLVNLTMNVQQIANSTQQNTANFTNLTTNVQQNTADLTNLTTNV